MVKLRGLFSQTFAHGRQSMFLICLLCSEFLTMMGWSFTIWNTYSNKEHMKSCKCGCIPLRLDLGDSECKKNKNNQLFIFCAFLRSHVWVNAQVPHDCLADFNLETLTCWTAVFKPTSSGILLRPTRCKSKNKNLISPFLMVEPSHFGYFIPTFFRRSRHYHQRALWQSGLQWCRHVIGTCRGQRTERFTPQRGKGKTGKIMTCKSCLIMFDPWFGLD